MSGRRQQACAARAASGQRAMPEAVRLRVTYADTDAMGVAWHGSYLRWFEIGRTELMRAAGLSYAVLIERGLNLPAVEALVRYRSSARYDDELLVRAAVCWAGGVRLRFDYRIECGGALVAEGHTEHAFTDNSGRVRRLPRDVQQVLAALTAKHGGHADESA